MSSLEDRVAALEAELVRVREQLSDTHLLAAHADRDVATFREELRAQTRMIQALHDNQVDQGQKITDLDREVQAGFAKTQAGIDVIVRMLEGRGDHE